MINKDTIAKEALRKIATMQIDSNNRILVIMVQIASQALWELNKMDYLDMAYQATLEDLKDLEKYCPAVKTNDIENKRICDSCKARNPSATDCVCIINAKRKLETIRESFKRRGKDTTINESHKEDVDILSGKRLDLGE